MTAHRRRALARRDNARAATIRRNYKAVAAVLDPPRKPLLTNGQVRRFVRRSLAHAPTNGALA